jgi:phage terminase large subunit-like protein
MAQARKSAKNPGSNRGRRNIAWIEQHCRIPEGKLVGQPVKLTAKQKAWIRRIYDTPTRLFILSMARKNAKTAFTAFLLLLHLCGPEAKANSQLYSAAQSRDQAAVLFELAAKMVRMSADLDAVVSIRDTAKQLLCPELGTLYHALSADASTSFGKSPVFVAHDELGQVKGPRSMLYESMETASAAQESPLSIVISTQAPTDADLLSLLIDDAKTGADPRNKVELFAAPMDMDPFSEAAIRAANPHFDSFMNKDEVRKQMQDAKRLPAREASYRNLILNQRIETRQPFIARTVWQENGEPPNELSGRIFLSLDLSSVADLTAAILMSEFGDVHPTFWLPSEGLAEKSRNDRVPYDIWAKQGYLQTTPGRAIEYEFVAEWLLRMFNQHDIAAVAFDRYNMRFLKPWLEKIGFSPEQLAKFVEFGQGFVSMSPAIRELESMLLAKKLRHGNHPVLTMCMNNVTTISDPAENRKFVKSKSTGRIDGAVALAMAVGVMGTPSSRRKSSPCPSCNPASPSTRPAFARAFSFGVRHAEN